LTLFEVDGTGAAVGAELGADKHHAEAFGAGDGLEESVAVFALGGVLRGGCAALGAEEGASFHGGIISEKGFERSTHNTQRPTGAEGMKENLFVEVEVGGIIHGADRISRPA
jgi:hypothetical protein